VGCEGLDVCEAAKEVKSACRDYDERASIEMWLVDAHAVESLGCIMDALTTAEARIEAALAYIDETSDSDAISFDLRAILQGDHDTKGERL
jgi:hypothetical protein